MTTEGPYVVKLPVAPDHNVPDFNQYFVWKKDSGAYGKIPWHNIQSVKDGKPWLIIVRCSGKDIKTGCLYEDNAEFILNKIAHRVKFRGDS